MTKENSYTDNFFELLQESTLHSAQEIVPFIVELIQPQNVIDIGCGLGTWLSVFKEYGVEDILGVDGDYLNKNSLQIPQEKFLSFDLSKPFSLERKFDLVTSLEVAEHLPRESAETFVDSLTKLGNVIVFSAAIPFQGGQDHHNEEWQDYWANHFQNRGYVAIDYIRRKVWQNQNVAFWYAQNTLIFVQSDYLESHPLLKKEFKNTCTSQLSIIHPDKYLAEAQTAQWYAAKADPRNWSLKEVLSVLPIITLNGIKRTIKNSFSR